MHSDLHHLFNSMLGTNALILASSTHHLDDIERYMNCTLQQKSALVLYKKNMIKLEELQDLDVHIHVLA